MHYYRPQTKLREGNVLQVSVIFFTGGVPGPRGVHGPRGVPGGDPPRTATAAGGTHPTGIHSCVFTAFPTWK